MVQQSSLAGGETRLKQPFQAIALLKLDLFVSKSV